MRDDRKLFIAILILICLVTYLIIISLQKSHQVDRLIEEVDKIKSEKTQVIKPMDGRTPVLGKDYFVYNGQDGDDAYHVAVKQGYVGTVTDWLESLKIKGDKGDTSVLPSVIKEIKCEGGIIRNLYQDESIWKSTNIKCEAL